MATKPSPPCRVCRKLHCVDPAHKPKPFAQAAPTRERRPGYDRERRRRRKFVKDALNATGIYSDGLWIARCSLCGRDKRLATKDWLADHVVPVAAGGSEDGPLRLSCVQCQRRQGGIVANRRQRNVQSSKTHSAPRPRRQPREAPPSEE